MLIMQTLCVSKELHLRFSQRTKLALLPTLYSHIYIYLQSLVNVKLDIIRGLHFKVSDFTGLVSWQY